MQLKGELHNNTMRGIFYRPIAWQFGGKSANKQLGIKTVNMF